MGLTAAACLLASAHGANAPAQRNVAGIGNAPVIKSGVQTVFSTSELTGNNAIKIVASSKYQISIVFPWKVQSVGVNAAKQSAVMATVDQYDGRVIYLDVVKPGGMANLNVRLLANGNEGTGQAVNSSHDPVILKLLIELTDKASGVLAYAVKNPAPRPVAPVPAPRPVVAAPRPTPVNVAPVAMKPATPPTAPVAAAPRPVAPRPLAVTAPRPEPTTFYGYNDGLKVEARVVRSSGDAQNITVNYTISQEKPLAGRLYVFNNQNVDLRIRNTVSAAPLGRGAPSLNPLTPTTPATGTVRIPRSEMSRDGVKILMFTLEEKDTATNRAQRKFLGVLLK